MKKISLLGSTGSIGTNTLRVISHLKDSFEVTALAAHSNIELLKEQIDQYKPEIVAVYDESKAKNLQDWLPNQKVHSGMDGVIAAATAQNADIVVTAIAGNLGLAPTVAAIKARKKIALANKEALISGGSLVISLAKEFGVDIIPIDSEHSAIFQCLNGENRKEIRRIILTSSGGPFRTIPIEQLKQISVEDALNHPTWQMGPKVTIDSSTLMNKGLEVIEAHWLFGVPLEKIEVVIHPQSIIHSMVEFVDGSIMAQISEPNMLFPIQYALTYPNRKEGILEPFDFTKNDTLTFFQPDPIRFRCLTLAYDAAKAGGTLPCYMNAANEILVNRFLSKELSWLDIAGKLESLMEKHDVIQDVTIDDLLAIDRQARQDAQLC